MKRGVTITTTTLSVSMMMAATGIAQADRHPSGLFLGQFPGESRLRLHRGTNPIGWRPTRDAYEQQRHVPRLSVDCQPGYLEAERLLQLAEGLAARTRLSDQPDGVNLRSRRLLLTTKTELKAIAAPAIIGLSRPAAAKGSAATL